MTGTSLLILGYNPIDWDFRVLFRGLVDAMASNLRRISVTVQIPPVPDGTPIAVRQRVQEYLNQYFDLKDKHKHMRVYWGTAQEFMNELKRRWQGEGTQITIPTSDEIPAVIIDVVRLYQNLREFFSKDELISLAFELRTPYENFREAKDGFALGLINYLQNRNRLHELVEACQKERPDISW
jgi:hypothetical protein